MKRILVAFFAVAAFCLASFAQKYTNLAIEALFDGRYHNNPNTSVSVIKNDGNVFRSISVSGNSRIVSEMERLVRKDSEKCTSTVENYEKGSYELIFTIGTTNIGFTKDSKTDANLWINCRTGNNSGRRKTSKASSKSKKTSSRQNKEERPSDNANRRCYAYDYSYGPGLDYSYTYDSNDGKGELDIDLSGLKSLDELDFSSLESQDLSISGLDSLKNLEIDLSGLEKELSSMGDAIRKDVKKALSKSFKKKGGDSNKQ